MSGPWEDYAKKSNKPKEEPKEEGPWDLYSKSKKEEQRLKEDFGKQAADRAPDLALLAGQGATFGHLDELQGAGEHLMGGDYTQARDEARDKIAQARERQGILGDVAEGAGSMVTSIAVPSLRGGTFLKELSLAALQGAGEAPEMEDIPAQAGKSMAMSTAAQAVSKVGLNKAFGEPDDILANTAGARGINRRKAGVLPSQRGASFSKDPADIANRLDEIGFFKPGDRYFNPKTKMFDLNPSPTGGKLEAYVKPATLDEYLKRTEMVTSELGKQNASLLKGKKIPVGEVDQVLIDTALDFIPAGAGVEKRLREAQHLVAETVTDLKARGAVKNGMIDAAELQRQKQFMQEKAAKSYENQALSDVTNEGMEARRTYATSLDNLLDKYGGKEYQINNDLMRDTYSQRKFIFDKDSRMRGESVSGAKLTRPKLGDHIMDMIDNPTVGYGRAKTGQMLEKPMGQGAVDFINRVPVEMMNNRQNDRGRKPQSVPNIPEELIRTPLPRDTQSLMQKKNFVLAKIAQMAPEMLESVKDVYDNNPEMLQKIAPVIAQKMPHLFQMDPYNRFDGRIFSEADKAKAIKDTLGDDRLSTIEQAKIITKLNKEGIYDR